METVAVILIVVTAVIMCCHSNGSDSTQRIAPSCG